MAAETDKFVIATFALWAGDVYYAEELLKDFSPPNQTSSIDTLAESPEAFIRATGALRLRQIWNKRGDFNKLAAEHSGQGREIVDKPTILKTEHFRATVWRVGEREFLLQGYLTDLSWQDRLFERASREAVKSKTGKPRFPRESDLWNNLADNDTASEPLGAAWIIAQKLFLQVELTDLGLLEAKGFWTEARLPENADAVEEPFLNLLRSLDEGETR